MNHTRYLEIMRKIDVHVKKKMLKVNSVFQKFDSSGDGQLSKIEFQQGMQVLLAKAEFTVDVVDIDGVFDTIDADGSNEMSYKEFATELKNSDPHRQASLIARLEAEQKRGLSLHLKQAEDRETRRIELEKERELSQKLDHLDVGVDPLAAVSAKARQFLKKKYDKGNKFISSNGYIR